MSRYPIVDSDELVYKKFYLSDSFARKGVLYAKIEIGDSHLHLFNSHTQANYFSGKCEDYKESVVYKLG